MGVEEDEEAGAQGSYGPADPDGPAPVACFSADDAHEYGYCCIALGNGCGDGVEEVTYAQRK